MYVSVRGAPTAERCVLPLNFNSFFLNVFNRLRFSSTTLTLTRHLGPGALFTRARDVQTGLPGESEWRGSRLAQQ